MGNALDLEAFINPEIVANSGSLATQFQQARPFRHVVIDGFLQPRFCERLCEQFPAFDNSHAVNENEEVGRKATRENVRALGTAYRDVDDLMQSPEFLSLVGALTGIDDLLYDPHYFGGGTHENLEGQDLDPHIDFNYHPVSGQHRRLNLIIYLNPEWEDQWGGSLQLHHDPYLEPEHDDIVTLTPLLNRCVIFETNEHSWHGFERIDLPETHKNLSRRSFAVYFYSEMRPAEELAGEHSTVYVERHLPPRFQAGMTLAGPDVQEIKTILSRRDQHLKRLYQDIRELYAQLNRHKEYGGAPDSIEPLEFETARTDLDQAVRTIQNLRNRIQEFETSTSWKLTAPMRAFKRLISGRA